MCSLQLKLTFACSRRESGRFIVFYCLPGLLAIMCVRVRVRVLAWIACLLTCMRACFVLACLRACVLACLRDCILVCVLACLRACVHEYMLANVLACVLACLHAWVRVCVLHYQCFSQLVLAILLPNKYICLATHLFKREEVEPSLPITTIVTTLQQILFCHPWNELTEADFIFYRKSV